MQIRPAPPFDFTDARSNQIGQEVNSAHVVAGSGISITKGLAGTTISVNNVCDPDRIVHQGEYDYNESYNPGDMVYVNPSYSFPDVTGSSRKPAPGSWICTQFVPCIGQDSSSLINTVWPTMNYAGMDINPNIANSFRHSLLNDYFPNTASNTVSWVSEETWEVSKGNTYWTPAGGSGQQAPPQTSGLQYYAIAQLYSSPTASWGNYGFYGAIPLTITYTPNYPTLKFEIGVFKQTDCPLKFIAKPGRQKYLAGETIEGVPVTYSLYTDNTRIAADTTGSNTEQQVVFPRYQTPSQCGYICDMTGSFGMPTSSTLTGSAVFDFLASQCVVAALPVDNTGEIIYEALPFFAYNYYMTVTNSYGTSGVMTWNPSGSIVLQEVLPYRVWARRFLQ